MTEPARILVVYDRGPDREVVVQSLRCKGYLTIEAGEENQVAGVSTWPKPDLIVLGPGLSLPQGYGEWQRSHPGATETPPPIIRVLSCAPGEVNGCDLPECDADAFVRAPVVRCELLAQVSAQLRMHRTEAVLRETERRLQIELQAARHLQQVSTELIEAADSPAIYDRILDTARALLEADASSFQVVCEHGPHAGELHLMGHRNLHPAAATAWEWLPVDTGAVFKEALRGRERVIVPEVLKCALLEGSPQLGVFQRSDIRAFQSTPLISRGGTTLGLLSTYWRDVHEPTPSQLLALDLLARQAADLIDRRRAEEELHSSQGRLKLALQAAEMGTWEWDLATNGVTWDERTCAIFGVNPETFRPDLQSFLAMVNKDDIPGASELFEEAVASTGHYHCEFRARRPDGEERWIANDVLILREPDGQPRRCIGTALDITSHKTAQNRLNRQAERQNALLEISRDIIATGPDLRALAEKVFGRAGPHLHADVCINYKLDGPDRSLVLVSALGIPPGVKPMAERVELGETLCGAVAATRRPIVADKARIAAEVRGEFARLLGLKCYACFPLFARDGGVMGTFCFGSTRRDSYEPEEVSFIQTICHLLALAWERAAAEAGMRRSEERFRRLVEVSSDVVWVANSRGELIEDSPSWCAFTGRGAGQFANWSWLETIHPDDRPAVQEIWRRVVAAPGPFRIELRQLHHSGEYRHMECQAAPIFNDDGRVREWVGRSADISDRKTAEAALRSALKVAELERQRLAAVLEALPTGVGISDLQGRITLFNAALTQIWGKSVSSGGIGDCQEWRGRWLDTGQPLAPADWAMARALRTGCVVSGDVVEIEKLDGAGRATIINAAAPIRDAGGAVMGAVVAAVDITAERRAEDALRASEERFRIMADGVPVIIWVTDPEGCIRFVNRQYCEFFGITVDQVQADGWQPLVHPDDEPAYLRSFHAALREQKPLRAQCRVSSRDGTWRWIESYGQPLFSASGEFLGMAGGSPDITERKEFQAELERVVAERTGRLQELVAELEHLSYTITHDMRAPLRAMRGFAEVIQEARAHLPEADISAYLQRIMTSAERMDLLITDALNYTRAVRQELPLGPVDLGSVLRGMLDTYPEFQAGRADIELQEGMPSVLGNEAGLTQCFSNLIGNAVKFVQTGRKPEVRIWAEIRPPDTKAPADEPDHQWVRIWVEDKGIGIPVGMLPKLFRMFSRGSREYEGTGIGLALVRKVVHRMGGRAGVESEVGKGSRFWVELRAAIPGKTRLPQSRTSGPRFGEPGNPNSSSAA